MDEIGPVQEGNEKGLAVGNGAVGLTSLLLVGMIGASLKKMHPRKQTWYKIEILLATLMILIDNGQALAETHTI